MHVDHILCCCVFVRIILCIFSEPLVIDPYYYWISRNRKLLIVSTIVLGNRMPTEKKTDCFIDNCLGVLEEPSLVCVICDASVHPACFRSGVRKLAEYPSSCHDEVFCSSMCCTWYGKEGFNRETVKKVKERS
jgi:hypothetical protein